MRRYVGLFISILALSGCSTNKAATSAARNSIASYCPYVSSPQTFSPSVTVTGTATYQYRLDGNGVIPDGTNAFKPSDLTNGQTASMNVNGQVITYTCATSSCPSYTVAQAMVTSVNANGSLSTLNVKAVGNSAVGLYRTGGAVTVTSPTNMTALDKRPIRYAEVRVSSAAGAIVQCAETDANGQFSLKLPSDGASYTVAVASRANNSHNTAYVMDTPTNATFYSLSTTVTASGSPSVSLTALATGDLLGGAFNILDQILNAQEYIRTQSSNCNVGASVNYYPDCQPLTTVPLVNVYWSAGLSPGVYYGISGGISFYLNGQKELYILGGVSGDTDVSDMDHFDNSVIIHEYGHFIEDQFGRPDSPGGSHNGNSIIDPRLAWGEGWSNFFQAAVTGIPYYRDTYGHAQCTAGGSCTGVNFNEFLDPTGGSYNDKPTAGATGEGNFREFSVSRLLWQVVKPGGVSRFSEIWTALNGPTKGTGVVTDRYKSIGRFHVIQQANSGHSDWTAIRNNELQVGDLSVYGTPITTASGCSPSSVPMTISKTSSDDGSFAKSDQYRNNDFYYYDHPGGTLTVGLSWSGASVADLDLYIYQQGYTFGTSSSMVAKDDTQTSTTSGTATATAASLPAGRYMINVMAYTGIYGSTGNRTTSYTMTINGQTACPAP